VESGRDKSGKFNKGNAGKPKGALSSKTKAWDELGEFFTQSGAKKAMEIINFYGEIVENEDGTRYIRNPDKYLLHYSNLMEYFKPKLQRTEGKIEIESDPIQFILPKP